MGTAAYIVIDPDFAAETDISWTMLHEFSHVLQYSVDFTETRYVAWEGTATASEWWSDRSLWPLEEYIVDFQSQPWSDCSATGGCSRKSTASGPSMSMVLRSGCSSSTTEPRTARVQPAVISGSNSAQEGWDNEPDFVDAMGMEFEDWTDGWLEFVITRAAVGTESTPVWGSRYSDPKFSVRVEETIDYAELPVTVTPEFQPIQTGAVYWAISVCPAARRFGSMPTAIRPSPGPWSRKRVDTVAGRSLGGSTMRARRGDHRRSGQSRFLRV